MDNGREAALRSLRRPVEDDRCREIVAGLCPPFGTLPACLLERAVDLHFHDLKPWRKQPPRRFVGLEHRLQQCSKALPGRESLPHQVFEFHQIGLERGDQQLNRNRCLTGRAGAASDVDQSDDEAIDFRPHPVRYFVAFLRCRGGEQSGRRCNQPIGRARDFHRTGDLRHAGIDQLEPIAHLAKRVDASGGGQHSEAADPEECEQQSPAYSWIPPPRCRNVGFSCVHRKCGHGSPAPVTSAEVYTH